MFGSVAQVIGPAKPKSGRRGACTIVIFADGTRNAFSTRQTNVWRLYQALDKSAEACQLARYIPGVGTTGFLPLRMLDAATGAGVPRNVRRLYRFLCWNWQPGDRIVLIGFSRGAFTVRTLAGLISFQGLMPREINGNQVSTAEMKRNACGAWRAYRAATISREAGNVGWTVETVRTLRNRCVRLWRQSFNYRQHEDIESTIENSPRRPVRRQKQMFPLATPPDGVRIAFLGVFDTVEAYGMPIEELRSFITRWIYPLTFSNHRCSVAVEVARHAIAIDEERLSFAHLDFDTSEQPAWQHVEERWFPGVHGDVGGGYPDDHVALEPLRWMIKESPLIFLTSATNAINADIFERAPIHDSRSGSATFYRYEPRRVQRGEIIDTSVIDKIRDSADVYAPIAIRNGARLPNGEWLAPICPDRAKRITQLVGSRRKNNRLTILLGPALLLATLLCVQFIGWRPWAACVPFALALCGIGFLCAKNGYYNDRIRDEAALGWSSSMPSGSATPTDSTDEGEIENNETAFAVSVVVLFTLGCIVAWSWR